MARYIDADKVLFKIHYRERAYGCSKKIYSKVIKEAPTADVRPERHGRNITEMNPVDEFVCSECGFIMRDTSGYDEEEDVYYEFELRFCPKCGAKMDGKDNNI